MPDLTPAYDIHRSYEDNYKEGPFIKGEILPRTLIRKRKFLGFEVNSLLGIPAGPLLNSRWIRAYAALGFDLPVYKTVRTRAMPSHPNPNCMFLKVTGQIKEDDFGRPLVATDDSPSRVDEISITNSFGMPSRDPKIWQEDIEKARGVLGEGQILIVSVVGTPGERDLADDYAKGAAFAKEAGAHVIEINLSCPNVVTKEGSVFTDSLVSSAISKSVKLAIGETPLIIKIGYIADLQCLADMLAANAPHVNGVSGINTLPFAVIGQNGAPALPGEGRRIAGVCGAAIRQCAMAQAARVVALARKEKYDFSVIGVGGVMTTQHIQDYFNLGVDAVMSATGAMWDPWLAYKYWKETNLL